MAKSDVKWGFLINFFNSVIPIQNTVQLLFLVSRLPRHFKYRNSPRSYFKTPNPGLQTREIPDPENLLWTNLYNG